MGAKAFGQIERILQAAETAALNLDIGTSRCERLASVNRLGGATSPYLLQHAENPVDWWPWCDEAFEEARRRDVPILVSVGYSSCHWCH